VLRVSKRAGSAWLPRRCGAASPRSTRARRCTFTTRPPAASTSTPCNSRPHPGPTDRSPGGRRR